MNETANNYSTYDMGLAAGLITVGFKLLGTDKRDPKRVEFILKVDQDDAELQTAIKQYWNRELVVSAMDYFNTTKMLKSCIYGS